jgi:hypothetical protein
VCPDRAAVRAALREHAASQQRGPRRGSKCGRGSLLRVLGTKLQHSVRAAARQRARTAAQPISHWLNRSFGDLLLLRTNSLSAEPAPSKPV